jgi:hypothetical protein
MINNTSTQIVRQSQIKTVTEILKDRGIQPTFLELMTITEVFTDYITNGTTKEVMDRVRKADEWLKTK